ncbi:hypothetical protein LCGC14_3017660 [marine sediment metagenome]|uniref:Uncharacterized protein n=1 Tax=marine sediment metagenome TaxID=412755 RepID=A0A0F8XJ40_9ZZZZ
MQFIIPINTGIEVERVEIDLRTGYMTLHAKLNPLKNFNYRQNQVTLGSQLSPNIFESIKDQIELIAKHNLQRESDEADPDEG